MLHSPSPNHLIAHAINYNIPFILSFDYYLVCSIYHFFFYLKIKYVGVVAYLAPFLQVHKCIIFPIVFLYSSFYHSFFIKHSLFKLVKFIWYYAKKNIKPRTIKLRNFDNSTLDTESRQYIHTFPNFLWNTKDEFSLYEFLIWGCTMMLLYIERNVSILPIVDVS